MSGEGLKWQNSPVERKEWDRIPKTTEDNSEHNIKVELIEIGYEVVEGHQLVQEYGPLPGRYEDVGDLSELQERQKNEWTRKDSQTVEEQNISYS